MFTLQVRNHKGYVTEFQMHKSIRFIIIRFCNVITLQKLKTIIKLYAFASIGKGKDNNTD